MHRRSDANAARLSPLASELLFNLARPIGVSFGTEDLLQATRQPQATSLYDAISKHRPENAIPLAVELLFSLAATRVRNFDRAL
jgi:hypothetical protein